MTEGTTNDRDGVPASREPETTRTEFPKRRAIRLDRRDEVGKRARKAVQEHCAGRLDDAVVERARLVASELVTNAFEHCTSGIVTLDVSIDDDAVVLTVSSPGSSHPRGIPPVNAWRVPPPTSPSGRGLGMIRLVADEVITDSGAGPDGRHWQVVSVRLTPESV